MGETYSLLDVSRITGIKETTLRFYLKRFKTFFEPLKRGQFNSIIFSDKDINLFLKIRTLSKQHGLSMDEIEKSLSGNNHPVISIKRDDTSPAALKEGFERISKFQKEVKEVLLENSLTLQDINASQQILNEKQQKLTKLLEGLLKLPEVVQDISETIKYQNEILTSISMENKELKNEILKLKQENEKLTKKFDEMDKGLIERFINSFKAWLFEEQLD